MLSIHIAAFVLTCLILLGFLLLILRPFLNKTSNETRRIAELLSQLPPNIDVEGLVQVSVSMKARVGWGCGAAAGVGKVWGRWVACQAACHGHTAPALQATTSSHTCTQRAPLKAMGTAHPATTPTHALSSSPQPASQMRTCSARCSRSWARSQTHLPLRALARG